VTNLRKVQRDHCSFSDNTNARHAKFTYEKGGPGDEFITCQTCSTAFGGVVTQRKTQSPPASLAMKVNAETWADMCDKESQEEYMHISVNILMEVDSPEADGNQ
jgi:hypothetical protein